MRKLSILLVLVAGTTFLLPEVSNAIPAFARKHGFNCNMCHTSFTKLNDFGQRFRDNGYQLPGQAGLEKNIIETFPPLSIRTSTGGTLYHANWRTKSDAVNGTTNGFGFYSFDFLAAGVLHKNISFLMIYTPRVDEPTSDFYGHNAGQNGSLESANIVFTTWSRMLSACA